MPIRQGRATRAQDAVVAVAILLSSLLVVARTTGYGPWGGDIAVWIFAHEWISRGVPLYTGVWDHKDWGFFAITNPFYRMAGITGLYLSGLLASLVFAVGTFLSTLSVVSWRRAAVITSVAAATYVVAPGYLSTYTENYAIAMAVLAVGMLARYPFAAGVVFALSASVKVSGLLLFALVVTTDAVLRHYGRRRLPNTQAHASFRVVAGFVLTIAAILSIASAQGSLRGWADVVSYNAEYGAIRRQSMPSLLDVKASLAFASPGLPTVIFVAASAVAVVGIIALVAGAMRFDRESIGPQGGGSPLVLNAVLLAGSVATLVAQYPPRFQHYQYLVGPALSLSAVLLAVLWARLDAQRRVIRIVSGLLCVAPLIVGLALVVRSEGPTFSLSGLTRWSQLEEGGDPLAALAGVPSQSSIAFVDIGGVLVDSETIPTNATLHCRFFYQYPHLLPRYGEQILNCLRKGPDFIVVRPGNYRDAEFQKQVQSVLETEYARCATTDSVFELWSSDSLGCPSASIAAD